MSNRFLVVWERFLKNEISQGRLNVRVWTMNNHFTTYHMPTLIEQQGPLRYYSCRSLERTIQKYSNLCKSKSRPHQDSENILKRLNFFKEFQMQQLQEMIHPNQNDRSESFLNYPGDDEGVKPQLWAKFQTINLNEVDDVYGVSAEDIYRALQLYYRRDHHQVAENDTVSFMSAARMLYNDLVYQSKYYRMYQSQLKRANNFVIFLAVEPGQ